MKNNLIIELLCALLLGGISARIVAESSGKEALNTYIKAINPGDPVFIYLAVLGVVSMLYLALAKQQSAQTQFSSATHDIIEPVARRVGFSLLGVYRTISGGYLFSSVYIVTAYPNETTYPFSLFALGLSVIIILACSGIEYLCREL
ncbi:MULTISPECIES: hypothetical protein [Vibrio]|uniref:hypothetical protein n=1 Tax=Vibrio TaxID=662 RepID=UPI000DFE53C8|nr:MULTISPECIES: hypothetical protein [Vibrio]MBO0246435.1 hypothetical protein [Vibrio sp. Vb0592]MCR9486620.1 hypothetical protein [Vibrio alginolyticus]MCR9543932.1 hypothetical protein [Vibrio alginolyticus]MCR9635856.1 hypothetical protein [Vibrio alginolyticus]MDW1736777.1 hypothetical protein [Vibrio sp. Vb2235]